MAYLKELRARSRIGPLGYAALSNGRRSVLGIIGFALALEAEALQGADDLACAICLALAPGDKLERVQGPCGSILNHLGRRILVDEVDLHQDEIAVGELDIEGHAVLLQARMTFHKRRLIAPEMTSRRLARW